MPRTGGTRPRAEEAEASVQVDLVRAGAGLHLERQARPPLNLSSHTPPCFDLSKHLEDSDQSDSIIPHARRNMSNRWYSTTGLVNKSAMLSLVGTCIGRTCRLRT